MDDSAPLNAVPEARVEVDERGSAHLTATTTALATRDLSSGTDIRVDDGIDAIEDLTGNNLAGNASECRVEASVAGNEDDANDSNLAAIATNREDKSRIEQLESLQGYDAGSHGKELRNSTYQKSGSDTTSDSTGAEAETDGDVPVTAPTRQEDEEDKISPNSTPPPRADEIDRSQYHTSLQEWGKSLHDAAQAVFPNTPSSRYRNVYVLMLKWKDEDPELPVSYDIPKLQDVFSKTYGFETELWDIQDHDCHTEVNQKVIDFSRKGGNSKEDLKILYYAGHGKITRNRLLSWTSWRNNKKMKCPTVKWSGIQNVLEEAQSDVLLLLDCCNAGIANTNEGEGVTELISACAYNSKANGVGYYSFTYALVLELKALSLRASFSVGDLYSNIYSRTQSRMPDDEFGTEQHSAPVHLVLTCDSTYRRSIQLSPRERLNDGEESYSQTEEGAHSSNPQIPSDGNLHVDKKAPRLALAIRFQNNLRFTDLSPDIFTDWLRSIPMVAEQVKVEAGFDSFSSLLIVSIPIALSAYLPWNPAVIYLGPITSKNRISVVQYEQPEGCVADSGQEAQNDPSKMTPDRQTMDNDGQAAPVITSSDHELTVAPPSIRPSRTSSISSAWSEKTETTFRRLEKTSLEDDNALVSYDSFGLQRPPTLAQLDLLHFNETLEAFSKTIQNAAAVIFPTRGQFRYTQVSCLLFSWEDEDPLLPVSIEIMALKDVLRNVYNYNVEEYKIPSSDSHRNVNLKILEFLGDEGPMHLKIVYYSGHGRITTNGLSEWTARSHTKSAYGRHPTVKWSGIQTALESSTSDVLILIDSDGSGICTTDNGNGVTELVAACGFSSHASGVGPYSFTHALTATLRDLSFLGSFTVSLLYNRIFTRMQSLEHSVEHGRNPHPVPIHLILSQDSDYPREIRLQPHFPKAIESGTRDAGTRDYTSRPLRIPPSSPDNDEPAGPFKDDPDSGSRALPSSSSSDRTPFPGTELEGLQGNSTTSGSPGAELLFSFRIQENLDLKDLSWEPFADWLRDLPIAAKSVRVESIFKSY